MNCARSCLTGSCVSDDSPRSPVRDVLEVEPVPKRQRLVEAVVLLERGDRRGVAGGLLAEVRRDGVARDELREREHDERDPDRRAARAQPHVAARSPGSSRRDGACAVASARRPGGGRGRQGLAIVPRRPDLLRPPADLLEVLPNRRNLVGTARATRHLTNRTRPSECRCVVIAPRTLPVRARLAPLPRSESGPLGAPS